MLLNQHIELIKYRCLNVNQNKHLTTASKYFWGDTKNILYKL